MTVRVVFEPVLLICNDCGERWIAEANTDTDQASVAWLNLHNDPRHNVVDVDKNGYPIYPLSQLSIPLAGANIGFGRECKWNINMEGCL